MAFSFMRSTSHRPDVAHLEDEEEDEQQQQMPVQWSGGVRAFSHLPAQKKPWRDEAARQEALGGRQRPFTPPEPVNKPYYVKPGASGRQGPFRPPEDDYDVYKKPLLHRPEDDYEVDVKPPNPLLDSLPPLEEVEDGDEMRPPARSGMVRAFSHLPERREAGDSDAGADAYSGAGQEGDNTRSWHPGAGSPEEGDDADHAQHDPGFATPTPQGWGKAGHEDSFATPSSSAALTPFGSSAPPKSRLFEQRLPPGAASEAKDQPPSLFKNAAATHAAGAHQPFAAKAAVPAQAAGQTQQNQAVTSAAQSAGSPPGSTALEPANRVRKLDETVPSKPVKPKKTRRSPTDDRIITTPDEQFAREMAAYEREKEAYEKALVTTAANHEFNFKNEQTFKAWENYDRAIQLMEKTPEGQKVLDRLRNDKNRVFKVVMLNNPATDTYLGRKLKHGAKGQYIYTGEKDEQRREIHVLLLDKTGINGDTLKENGQIDPDAESLENIWHELYHAYERHGSPTDSIDPLGVGTVGPTDRWLPPVSHEKRAVRFENIIRARNKGTRKKDKYGGGKYPDPDGVVRDHPPLPIPDELPPLTPVPLG